MTAIKIAPELPVAEIVLLHSGAALVFDRHGIDYCCDGHLPLARACRDLDLDLAGVLAELAAVVAEPDPETDPRTATTSALISHSIARQHRHLRATLVLLELQAGELTRDHGQAFPVLRSLFLGIKTLAEHLLHHMDVEEDELFPALLAGAMNDKVRQELAQMFDEHREFDALLQRLRDVSGNYTPPAGANANIQRLFRGMAELEGQIQRHHHVEIHVLMPRFR